MTDKLFDIEPVFPDKFCRSCEHRQRWRCGGKVIQYCGVRKSNITDNGLMKIKVTMPACIHYEPEIKQQKP